MKSVIAFRLDRPMWHVVEDACEIAGMEARLLDGAAQDMASALYREPGSIGIFRANPTVASLICSEWRHANIANLLFVLLPPTVRRRHAACASVLNAGADDVQDDAICAKELAARLIAIAGRERAQESPFLHFCNCSFNSSTGDIYSPAGFVKLTSKESDFLAFLISREGMCVTKQMFLDYIYHGRDEPEPKIIDVFASKVRKKLFGLTGGRDVIETIWGRGFRFVRDGVVPAWQHSRRVS